jgi:hypothetical protein
VANGCGTCTKRQAARRCELEDDLNGGMEEEEWGGSGQGRAATDLIGLVRAHSVLTRAAANLVVLTLAHTLLVARAVAAVVLVGLAHAPLIGAVTHALLIINKADLSSLAHILLVVGAKGAGAATVPLVITHHALLFWAVASNLLNLQRFQMESWTPSHLLALRL